MTCNDSAMASAASGGMVPSPTSLTWEKLSPAEFQQLQDFAACKLINYLLRHDDAKLGLFRTLKLALVLQFIVMNAYFSVARMLTLVLHATLK